VNPKLDRHGGPPGWYSWTLSPNPQVRVREQGGYANFRAVVPGGGRATARIHSAHFAHDDTVGNMSDSTSAPAEFPHPVTMTTPGSRDCDVCPPPFGLPHHPQMHLAMRDRGWVTCVDAGIAPLVAELWAVGIRTQYSCERMEGDRAYVLFPTARDASALLEIARLNAPAELFDRMTNGDPDGWNFDVALPMSAVLNDETVGVGDSSIRIAVSFPYDDIVPLTSLLSTVRGGVALPFPSHPAGPSERPSRLPAEVLGAIKALEAARRELQLALDLAERDTI
jgi:hypothetical protein